MRNEATLEAVLERIRIDEEYDGTDGLYALFSERMKPMHWCDIADWADDALIKAGLDAPYGDALHAIVHSTIAHAYRSGICAVAKALAVDAEALEFVCADYLELEYKEPPVGIDRLPGELVKMRKWLDDLNSDDVSATPPAQSGTDEQSLRNKSGAKPHES